MKNFLRSIFIISFLVVGFSNLFASGSSEANSKKLFVYATKSFAGEYGPGPKLASLFKEKTGIDIEYVLCKEGVLNRAITEGSKTNADILIGIDNHLFEVAQKAKILQAYRSKNVDKLASKDIIISDDWLLTPYDYGYFAFMYDQNSNITAPKRLKDLIKPEYKGKIIIFDPRISTPGLGLVAWTEAVFADEGLDFWKELKPNIFTMPQSWSSGYGLFTAGEAPLVLSYTTSYAYHVLYDKTERFQPLIFEDGHVIQIEGMGISAYTKNLDNAKEFIDFMLTEEAQACLPETQFMFPAIKTLALPESYRDVPSPKRIFKIPTQDQSSLVDSIINVLQE